VPPDSKHMPIDMPKEWPGEEQAWKRLAALDPHQVSTRAAVVFDPASSSYMLQCFGQVVRVALEDRTISSRASAGALLVEELGEFSRLSILFYLIHAQDVPRSGQLVKPSELRGGEIFVQGTHVLPLDKVARRFGHDPTGFFNRGRVLGGTRLKYGDMALELVPFPRLPVVLIVWSGDEEFPPQASLLLDSTGSAHLAADVIWATANLTIELMLR
jgi:hypothetical protein